VFLGEEMGFIQMPFKFMIKTLFNGDIRMVGYDQFCSFTEQNEGEGT